MPKIHLSREATGRELVNIIKSVAEEMNFKYYNSSGYISVGRHFSEHVPKIVLKLTAETIPYLEFKFGRIYLRRNYSSLQCKTMIGSQVMQPINFEDNDNEYKPYYDKFVDVLIQHLK